MAAYRAYRLPNGLTVHGLSALDTGLVYRDIFEEGYARHGVTVRDGDCVFDVGANTGLFLVYLNQVCNGARVFAFEPVPRLLLTTSESASRICASVGCGVRSRNAFALMIMPLMQYPHCAACST